MKILRENIAYKLLALAVAVIIWIYANETQRSLENPNIRSSQVIGMLTDLSLDLRIAEPGCIVTARPSSINLTIKGTPAHVRALLANPDSVMAFVNLRGKGAGDYTLPVNVVLPGNLADAVTWSAAPETVHVTIVRNADLKN